MWTVCGLAYALIAAPCVDAPVSDDRNEVPVALARVAAGPGPAAGNPGELDHDPGPIAVLRADDDTLDDFVIATDRGAWLYHGTRRHPFFRSGHRLPLPPRPGVLADAPVFDGIHLYVPYLQSAITGVTQGHVLVLSKVSGFRRVVATHWLLESNPGAVDIRSLRLVAKDGVGAGVFAVAGEDDVGGRGGVQTWTLRGAQRPTHHGVLPTLAGMPRRVHLVDVIRVHTVHRRADEFLIVYSSDPRDRFHGFGLQAWHATAGTGGKWWFGPALHVHTRQRVQSPVAAVHRTAVFPYTQLAARTASYGTRLPSDGAIFFGMPAADPPYVRFVYSPLLTDGLTGSFVDAHVGDLSGDGADDVAFSTGRYVAAYDPDLTRRFASFHDVAAPQRSTRWVADHGAGGDFDGDGRRDLMLVVSDDPRRRSRRARLSLLKGVGDRPRRLVFAY